MKSDILFLSDWWIPSPFFFLTFETLLVEFVIFLFPTYNVLHMIVQVRIMNAPKTHRKPVVKLILIILQLAIVFVESHIEFLLIYLFI